MSLTKLTLINSGWRSATVAVQAAAQLIVTAVLARLLSPADFGIVAIANIVIGFAGTISRFGLGQAVIQRRDLTSRHIRVAFTGALATAAFLMAVLIMAAPVLGQFFRNTEVTNVMRVLSFSFLFTNLGLVAESLIVRELAFRKLFWITVVTYVFGYALVGIGLAVQGFGVWSLVGAALASCLTQSVALLLIKPHPKRICVSGPELLDLTHFGGGMTLSTLLKYVANNGDRFVVGRWLGVALLGIYQQAFNIMVVFSRYLGDILEAVLFAAASMAQDEPDRIAKGYGRALSLINLVLLPLSLIMIVLAPEIVAVYLGPKWGAATLPAQILLAGVSFRSQSRISDAFVNALGVVYPTVSRKGVFAVIVVLGSLLAMRWGIIGVASAVTAAMVLDYGLVVELGLRVTGTKWRQHLLHLLPGVSLGVLVLVVSVPLARFFRLMFPSPWVVLMGVLSIAALIVAGVIRLFPSVLGEAGRFFVEQVLGMLPRNRRAPRCSPS